MKGISAEYPMYYGAKPSMFKLARELRKNQTKAEKILWTKINKNQILGNSFRRQHPINRYIADFYCVKLNLAIEIDGSIHDIIDHQLQDQGRCDALNDFGITVIRFTNEQVIEDTLNTVSQIKLIVEELMDKTSNNDGFRK